MQNLGEAEYVVWVYQYMRLRGYPADRISILTTYNGQKALIRDIVEQRCANHPAFGRPLKVVLLLFIAAVYNAHDVNPGDVVLARQSQAPSGYALPSIIQNELFLSSHICCRLRHLNTKNLTNRARPSV
jgi:hypothetical protein